MIDFHCHLDLYPDPIQVVSECEQRKLCVLSVTTTPSAWKGTHSLARGIPDIITALGLHPQLAHERFVELPLFDELLPQIRYVGEIGLDGAPELRQHTPRQLLVFRHILTQCSKIGGRIMSIHSRRATQAVLDELEAFPDAGIAILHWFSGTSGELAKAIELGCWFSVGPSMLKSTKGRALVSRMPPERVLTETDGPFAYINGSALLPWEVTLAVQELSKIWDVTMEDTQMKLLSNLENLCARS